MGPVQCKLVLAEHREFVICNKFIEDAFCWYIRMFGSYMLAKRDEAQEREASIGCGLLNRVREWGRPQSYWVS